MLHRSKVTLINTQDDLVINPLKGIAYQVNTDKTVEYDNDYFKKYQEYEDTDIGRKLLSCRIELVEKYCPNKPILDIGVGSGIFVASKHGAYGYDINPVAIKYLKDRELYVDPYKRLSVPLCGFTFWDSLEHIPDPKMLLNRIKDQYVFVSLPIVKDIKHVRTSKHYRPNEHFWYFTRDGFVNYMKTQGFELQEHNVMETHAGREDIETFVFRR